MLCGCFALACMAQFASQLRAYCDWRITALARSSLALVFALGCARLFRARLVLWKPLALWLRGAASSISLLCTFFALAQSMPTAVVLTLTNTFPIWVAILSWPLLGVPPTLSVWLSALCGVLGVVLIEAPHLDTGPAVTIVVVLGLVAALANAIAMLGLHRLKGVNPWAIVVHYSGVATLVTLGSWFFGEPVDMTPIGDTATLWRLLGVGIAATLGQLCVTQAFTFGQPARVAVVGLMQVIFALGLDVAFEGFTIPIITLAGIVLVLAPTAWVMVGQSARRK
jgi:drug/metabolite transporter (DMT)-like permease